MKPFSAGYFFKENRGRCMLLIFMFFLTYIAYIGGLYITNLGKTYEYSIAQKEKYWIVYPAITDEDFYQYEKVVEKMEEVDGITVLPRGVISILYTKSIMGFDVDYPAHAFRSVEDFKTYCDYMGISCDFTKVNENSFIASQLTADHRGMELGDNLEANDGESVYGKYSLDAITDENGYTSYFINSDINVSCVVLPTGMPFDEFKVYMDGLKEEFDFDVSTVEDFRQNIESNTKGFKLIYIFIVILLAIVMAITINAAFVGMYQHRQPEFAVYRAIGISKKRIVGKVIKELLLLDVMGIILGGLALFLVIYLLNHLYLAPRGLKLYYYDSIALYGMLLCNLAVLFPLIITRSRQLLRADVCDY